jgi:hypothetical protein
MELALNLFWVLLTALMLFAWVRFAPCGGLNRRRQALALALLVLLLFPVISVTDDLQTSQNFAEADCCLKRHDAMASPHSLLPSFDALPSSAFTGICLRALGVASPAQLFVPPVQHLVLHPIQNRPPPSA